MFLHSILVAVGLLGWCVGLYFASILTWTLLRKSRPQHAIRWMRYVKKLKNFKERGRASLERIFVTTVLFMSSLVLTIAMTRPPRYPIVTEHNVTVIKQLPDGDWAMKSDEEGSFAYRPCGDLDINGMLNQAIGYTAPRATWEERVTCKSIRAANLGFHWRDDKTFQYRKETYNVRTSR